MDYERLDTIFFFASLLTAFGLGYLSLHYNRVWKFGGRKERRIINRAFFNLATKKRLFFDVFNDLAIKCFLFLLPSLKHEQRPMFGLFSI